MPKEDCGSGFGPLHRPNLQGASGNAAATHAFPAGRPKSRCWHGAAVASPRNRNPAGRASHCIPRPRRPRRSAPGNASDGTVPFFRSRLLPVKGNHHDRRGKYRRLRRGHVGCSEHHGPNPLKRRELYPGLPPSGAGYRTSGFPCGRHIAPHLLIN